MKKNILAIAILAAVIANIIISGVMLFSIIPAANSANEMIKKICQVIDLELEDPIASDYVSIPLADRVPELIGDKLTVNLKKPEGQTKSQFVQVSFTIVFNKGSEQYEDVYNNVLPNQKSVLNNYVTTVIGRYTADELVENREQIHDEVLKYCKSYFGVSDLVLDVLLDIIIP